MIDINIYFQKIGRNSTYTHFKRSDQYTKCINKKGKSIAKKIKQILGTSYKEFFVIE